MSFYEFMKLGQKLHESKMNQYFSASLFLKLPRDQLGRIDHSHLANFVDRGGFFPFPPNTSQLIFNCRVLTVQSLFLHDRSDFFSLALMIGIVGLFLILFNFSLCLVFLDLSTNRLDSQKRWRLFLARFDDDLDQKLKREVRCCIISLSG